MNPIYNEIAMVSRLANDDITKFKEIYDIPYTEALNLLSYMKNRDELIEKQNNIKEAHKNGRTRK